MGNEDYYQYEAYLNTFASMSKYITGFSWAFITTFFYYPVHTGLIIERSRVNTGHANQSEESLRARTWFKVEHKLDWFLERLRVPEENIEASPIHRMGMFSGAAIPFIGISTYAIFSSIDGLMDAGTLIYCCMCLVWLPMGTLMSVAYPFMDLDKLMDWKSKVTSLAIPLNQLLIIIVSIAASDSIVVSAAYSIIFLAFSTLIAKEHKYIVKEVSKQASRQGAKQQYCMNSDDAAGRSPPMRLASLIAPMLQNTPLSPFLTRHNHLSSVFAQEEEKAPV